jgi:hypothetical protein
MTTPTATASTAARRSQAAPAEVDAALRNVAPAVLLFHLVGEPA